MGKLKYPFIAGAGATIILCIIASAHLFPRWDTIEQGIGGAVIGLLASVVLYALMRALAERS